MSSVRVEAVCKTFGQVQALSDVSLDIADGELMVLLGPSGCGKTTLLRSVAGIEAIDSGAVFIDGRRVDELAPHRRNVAMVFQSYALYPNLTVFENIAFPLRARHVERHAVQERVRSAAERLGVSDLLARRPRQLSGGQRQRVAIARAIVREPDVFLLDEPLSNLDAQLRVHMRAELMRLQRRLATTTVLVTHDQVEAMTMGDRITVMHCGRIQQTGRPAEIYRRPANTFVAGFVGSPAMNLVPAAAAERSGVPGLALRGDGWIELPPHARPLAAAGGGVFVGIRPEDIEICGAGSGFVGGRADLVEYLGGETVVTVVCGAQEWQVRLAGDEPVSVGESVRLSAAADRIHLFGGETGSFAGTLAEPAAAERLAM